MLYIWLEIGEISKPADNDRPPGAVQPQPQSPVTADRAGPSTLTDSLPVYARDLVLIFLKRYETFEWQNYYSGHVFMPVQTRISQLSTLCCESARYPPDTPLRFCMETNNLAVLPMLDGSERSTLADWITELNRSIAECWRTADNRTIASHLSLSATTMAWWLSSRRQYTVIWRLTLACYPVCVTCTRRTYRSAFASPSLTKPAQLRWLCTGTECTLQS